MKHAIILGGGISGVTTAWFLHRLCPDIKLTVIEKKPCVGGWIHSFTQGNNIWESGPRGFIPSGKGENTLELASDLGLNCLYADASAKKRFLFVDRKLQALPTHPLQMLSSSLMRPFIATLWKERNQLPSLHEETIEQFFTRRFSSAFTKKFIDPFFSGIFAGNISQLSLNACFPKIKAMENQHGSIVRAMLATKKIKKIPLASFEEGMQTLPKAIYQQLKNKVNFLLSTTVKGIHFKDHWSIELEKEKLNADWVFSALPAPILGSFLRPLSAFLDIPHASLVTVNLGFQDNVLKQKGFGYLIPESEKESILGMTWDSHIFKRSNGTQLTVMIGGSRCPQASKYTKKQLTTIATDALKRHLGITAKPTFIHTETHLNAIPQYLIGHSKKIGQMQQLIAKEYPSLYVTGNYLAGIGVNDCITHAKTLCTSFAQNR